MTIFKKFTIGLATLAIAFGALFSGFGGVQAEAYFINRNNSRYVTSFYGYRLPSRWYHTQANSAIYCQKPQWGWGSCIDHPNNTFVEMTSSHNGDGTNPNGNGKTIVGLFLRARNVRGPRNGWVKVRVTACSTIRCDKPPVNYEVPLNRVYPIDLETSKYVRGLNQVKVDLKEVNGGSPSTTLWNGSQVGVDVVFQQVR